MTEKDETSDEVTVETTSVFRADFLNDLDAPASPSGDTSVSGVEGAAGWFGVAGGQTRAQRRVVVPAGPADDVGRPPSRLDIFLDDVTVSRRHAEFRSDSGEFQVVDVGSPERHSPCQPGSRWTPRRWPTATRVQIGKFRLVFLSPVPSLVVPAARDRTG